jgi:AraC-like DNA-binding protein
VGNLLTTLTLSGERFLHGLKRTLPFDERLKSEHAFVNRATALIVQRMDDTSYGVNELASALNLSRSQLHRKLQALAGCSTSRFIRTIRLEYAKDLLQQGDETVAEIAYRCGFNSPAYFTTCFIEHTGVVPSNWTAAT